MSPASRGTIQVQPQQAASEQTTDAVPSELSPHSEGEVEGSEQNKEIFDQYCGQVYTKKGVNDCRVYFVITRNLDAHRTVSTPICHSDVTTFSTRSILPTAGCKRVLLHKDASQRRYRNGS